MICYQAEFSILNEIDEKVIRKAKGNLALNGLTEGSDFYIYPHVMEALWEEDGLRDVEKEIGQRLKNTSKKMVIIANIGKWKRYGYTTTKAAITKNISHISPPFFYFYLHRGRQPAFRSEALSL